MGSDPPPTTGNPPEYDPVFVHSRRELFVILGVWGAALLWAVPYCYFTGYGSVASENLSMVWGIPSWVFWGIFAPWIVADLVTIWFCFSYMVDDDLGEAADENEVLSGGSNASASSSAESGSAREDSATPGDREEA